MQVSLITCTSNSEKTIKKCCQSVHSQNYNDIEHIIIDKDSQDKTISIVKQYKLKNIKIYNQKGFGIYNALNEGMKLCNGKIIGRFKLIWCSALKIDSRRLRSFVFSAL